ncbi:hypothetical protein F4813DRAFT_353470 [Daldinia decipiens]|uniref:uncharacterized protein n=1 Tax=Daldinia decipiens TaxID=326647 RepID=UPI0020C3F93E|nr:uncharacterized protein F4813DRAFT_353470 [Daldinia decipiens]KAI1659608.1 hypothetical protein F4813DRAFT_353470 [Daldinia decipiens]
MDNEKTYYSPCDPPAPPDFYCTIDTSCIVLAANTTVLCCPKEGGGDCQEINVIACNLDQQGAFSSVQTTVKEGKLPTCGIGCCPWGYHCGPDDLCYMDDDQSKPPPILQSTTNLIIDHPSTGTSSSLQSIPTTFDTSVISQNPSSPSSYAPLVTFASSSGDPSITVNADSAGSSGSTLGTGEIVGISLGGFFSIALVALVVCFMRRARKSKEHSGEDEQSQDTVTLDSKDVAKLHDPYRELHGTPVFELSS